MKKSFPERFFVLTFERGVVGILDRIGGIRPSTNSSAFDVAFAQLKSVDDRNLVPLKNPSSNPQKGTLTYSRIPA